MTDRNNPEQRVPPDDGGRVMAELLWKYIEELKQTDNPEDVQFVAVTRGECAEVVGLMETAAEGYVLARLDSAPHCRREAVRRRLRSAMEEARAVAAPDPTEAPRRPSIELPSWLTRLLSARSAGWVAAAAALVALLWLAAPRPPAAVRMPCAEAVTAIPKLVAGTLDANATRALWAHLIECKGCMKQYEKEKAAHLRARPSGQSGLPLPPAVHRAVWKTGQGTRVASSFLTADMVRAR